jgi:hypothetical protein
MKGMNISKMEKGEYDLLLEDKNVQAVGGRNKRGAVKSWRKCLCLTLGITLALLFVTTTIVVGSAYVWMRHQVKRFTVDSAPTLPFYPLPDVALELAKDEAKLFWDTLAAGRVPREDLVLTQAILNGFIAQSDFLRGHATVTLGDAQVATQLALPADGLPGGKGRFFVGDGLVTTEATASETRIAASLTPAYKIEGLDFATILWTTLVAHREGADHKAVLVADYGQLLNWVIPDDWIAERNNLLTCDEEDDDEDREECEAFMEIVGRLEGRLEHNQIVLHALETTSDDGGGNRRLAESKEYSHGRLARRILRKVW